MRICGQVFRPKNWHNDILQCSRIPNDSRNDCASYAIPAWRDIKAWALTPSLKTDLAQKNHALALDTGHWLVNRVCHCVVDFSQRRRTDSTRAGSRALSPTA